MHKKPNQRPQEKVSSNRINERITGVSKVRLVSDTGSEIITLEEALQRSKAESLDLVEISGGQEVPVCKIINYGKYKFEQLKKSKEAKKKQHVVTIKEIKIRPRIGLHDYEIKKLQAIEFLTKGDKVKVSLRFKGRELAHSELGMAVVIRMVEDLKEAGMPEKNPAYDGKQIVVLINPK